MDKKRLSLGRTSPVQQDTSSPIKAIRVNRATGKDGASLASVTDLGWPSSWHDGVRDQSRLGKVKGATQRRKINFLQSENQQLETMRDSLAEHVASIEKKLLEKEDEVEKLRELNYKFVQRLQKTTAEKSMDGGEVELFLKHNFEKDACDLREELQMLKKRNDELLGTLASERLQYAEAQKEWNEQRTEMQRRTELLMQECNKATAVADTVEKQLIGAVPAAESVHVMLLVIGDGGQAHEKAVEITCDGFTMETADMDSLPDSQNVLEAEPKQEPCASTPPVAEAKEGPATPPISPGKVPALDVTAPEFERPIPSNISWADIVEDDSRWYEESDEEACTEQQPMETPVESPAELPAEQAYDERNPSSDSEEPAWYSRRGHGEFRAFRAFNHYRATSFDNSSKRTPKRSPRRGPMSASPLSHGGLAKPSTPQGSRHQRHGSVDRNPGRRTPTQGSQHWSEWNAAPSSDYGPVHKVSAGVLVVDRKTSRLNPQPARPKNPVRSKSDIPQCRRHIAGYCKFEDRCWFRHD